MFRSIPPRLPLQCLLHARPSIPRQRCLVPARHPYSNKTPLGSNDPSQTPQDQPRLQTEESAVDAVPISDTDSNIDEVGLQGDEVSAEQSTEATVKVDVEKSTDTPVSPAVDESIGDEDFLDSTETTRTSILDLFGPETRQSRSSKPPTQVDPEKYNPLSAHGLDKNGLDLSSWQASQETQQQKSAGEFNPEEWADTRRSVGETEDIKHPLVPKEPPETSPLHSEVREMFQRTQRPRRKLSPLNIPLPEDTPISSSPWDYFYPPARPPRSLKAVEEAAARSQHPSLKNKDKGDVYDPFSHIEKQVKWPFFYHRDQLVSLCTNHIMRDGKKARAEKIMQEMFMLILEKYPRMHPVTLFAEALDKNAPLFKHLSAMMGAKIKTVPVPLNERQRIRVGWFSMVRPAARGGNTIPFSQKLADEVIKAYEGKSGGLQNRLSEHKKAMSSKLNMKLPKQTRQ